MKKTTFVALLLLSTQCFAENLSDSLQSIESEWASIYYSKTPSNPEQSYGRLLDKTIHLADQYPQKAEPLIWEAIIKSSNANHQDAVSALTAIHQARDLLLKAITINPTAMEGAAYVTLGTLYYMTPQWPIAFGDSDEAKKLLETALKINPNGIDSNYFYGDFLLSNNELHEAEKYFKKAISAKVRPTQKLADTKLIEEAKQALKATSERKLSNAKGLFASVFNTKEIK